MQSTVYLYKDLPVLPPVGLILLLRRYSSRRTGSRRRGESNKSTIVVIGQELMKFLLKMVDSEEMGAATARGGSDQRYEESRTGDV